MELPFHTALDFQFFMESDDDEVVEIKKPKRKPPPADHLKKLKRRKTALTKAGVTDPRINGASLKTFYHKQPRSVTFDALDDAAYVALGKEYQQHLQDEQMKQAREAAHKRLREAEQKEESAAKRQKLEAEDDHHCLICLTTRRDVIAWDCGHIVYCEACSKEPIVQAMPACPLCRLPIKQIKKVFF
jgi:hypothetical protein